jgi:phospholipid/cholesterol/gamma-HCH transport system ATP-binding protein
LTDAPNTAAPASSSIEVKGLRKSYGNHVVLDSIDFEISPGESLAILGLSGTGKSVLLKLLVGLERPDRGSILIHGADVTVTPPAKLNELRKQIGFLFQSSALYDSISVRDNVAFPLQRHSDKSEADQQQQVQQLLTSVGMDKDGDKMPAEISGGMKKRVGLARALALSPEILLFDEPTAGLDPITADDIGQLIAKVQREQKLTSVIVTHDVSLARVVAGRLALLRDGRILISGSFEELQRSRDPFVSRFFKLAS